MFFADFALNAKNVNQSKRLSCLYFIVLYQLRFLGKLAREGKSRSYCSYCLPLPYQVIQSCRKNLSIYLIRIYILLIVCYRQLSS